MNKKMKLTKKNIVIISISSVLIALTIVFLSLGLTIWKPRSTEEWLADFSSSLLLVQDQSNQKTEKTISIEENGVVVSSFYQLVEINNQDNKPVGHIIVEEKYPTIETNDFNTYDEYFFFDNTMHMRRTNGDEVVNANFSSTWAVFWEVVNESIGENKYVFEKALFNDFELKHKKGVHTLKTTLFEETKNKFFNNKEEANQFSDVSFVMSLDKDCKLIDFSLQYKLKQNQNVKVEIKKLQSTEIKIKDFSD